MAGHGVLPGAALPQLAVTGQGVLRRGHLVHGVEVPQPQLLQVRQLQPVYRPGDVAQSVGPGVTVVPGVGHGPGAHRVQHDEKNALIAHTAPLQPARPLILGDEPPQGLDARADGQVRVVGLGIGEPRLGPLLVGHGEEHRTAAHPQAAGHHEQGGGLHLRGQHPAADVGLPLVLQLVAHRLYLRLVLAVEAVLALDHPDMAFGPQLFRGGGQGVDHLQGRHRGELQGGVLPAGALHAHRAGGDDQVAAQNVLLHAAAGAHPHKGVGPAAGELLHGDGGRRPPNARGGDADFHPVQQAGVGHILPAVRHELGLLKIGGDFLAALGVPGQQHVSAHHTRPQAHVVLQAAALGVVDHIFSSHPGAGAPLFR